MLTCPLKFRRLSFFSDEAENGEDEEMEEEEEEEDVKPQNVSVKIHNHYVIRHDINPIQ